LRHAPGKLAILVAVTLLGVGGGLYLWLRYPDDDFRAEWAPERADFPLRQDRPPTAWKKIQINEGLPLRWEKGTVYLLAWEVIKDDRPWEHTQALVLKKFHRPTAQGGHTWVLAQLYHHPEDAGLLWEGPRRIPPPLARDEKMPQLTDTELFGYEFYQELPTDEQIQKFLNQTNWTPRLGTEEAVLSSGVRTITTRLTAGGIHPVLWERIFHRGVPTDLFPELKKVADGKH
jgi:hypothetical protein